MNEPITLTIPADPQMLLVARMALSGYCCQLGADVETLDDVRTLSDEACYCLMHQPCGVSRLIITASPDGARARIRFEAELCPAPPCASPHDPEIARAILASLAADVAMQQEKGAIRAIDVTMHLAPL
ncbi:MAG: hypothetical protein LBM74_01485 [Oscillospiraceae bacterium]|jgi:hypothetical protein|nr:hypothetical protein [Oscillospiraceae bacterium]